MGRHSRQNRQPDREPQRPTGGMSKRELLIGTGLLVVLGAAAGIRELLRDGAPKGKEFPVQLTPEEVRSLVEKLRKEGVPGMRQPEIIEHAGASKLMFWLEQLHTGQLFRKPPVTRLAAEPDVEKVQGDLYQGLVHLGQEYGIRSAREEGILDKNIFDAHEDAIDEFLLEAKSEAELSQNIGVFRGLLNQPGLNEQTKSSYQKIVRFLEEVLNEVKGAGSFAEWRKHIRESNLAQRKRLSACTRLFDEGKLQLLPSEDPALHQKIIASTQKGERPQLLDDQREDYVIRAAADSANATSAVVYGADHDPRNNLRVHNQRQPSRACTLVILRPASLGERPKMP